MAGSDSKNRFDLEGLEPRVLLSADLAPAAACLSTALSDLFETPPAAIEVELLETPASQEPTASGDLFADLIEQAPLSLTPDNPLEPLADSSESAPLPESHVARDAPPGDLSPAAASADPESGVALVGDGSLASISSVDMRVVTLTAANSPPRTDPSDSHLEPDADIDAPPPTDGDDGAVEVRSAVSRAALEVAAAPDLIISADSTAPLSDFVHHTFPISYTVTNQGSAPAPAGTWWDAAYLSTSATFDPDAWIGWANAVHESALPLDPGAGYQGTLAFRVEPWRYADMTPGATYYLFLVTDNDGQVAESDEGNNVAPVPVPLSFTRAAIDLAVTGVAAPEGDIEVGAPATVDITVANSGSDPATGIDGQLWVELFASLDANFVEWYPDYDVKIGEFPLTGLAPLGAGQSATAKVDFIAPAGLAGNAYYLFARVNQVWNLSQPEDDLADNIRGASAPTAFLAPTMDLVVSSVETPASATTGHPATIAWTVTNTGASTAGAATWTDYLYLSADPAYGGGDILVTTRAHTGGLAPGAAYTAEVTVPLPHAQAGYFVVYTDAIGNQPESSEENNTGSGPVDLTFAPGNLTVTGAQTPASAAAGDAIDLAMTVSNVQPGTYAVGAWNDVVYLSDDALLDDGDTWLTSVYKSDMALAAGDDYTWSTTLNLPRRGGAFLLFVTDYYGDQAETDEGDNLRAVPLAVAYTPPDLVVSQAGANPSSFSGGTQVTVSWTVTNQGAGDAYPRYSAWYDRVYLSADAVWDANDLQLQAYAGRSAPLAAGQSYDQSQTFTFPAGRVGNFLIFKADGDGDVAESDEANNTRAVAIDMPSPDLVVVEASVVPDAAGHDYTDRTVTISYRVENQGDAAAANTWWYDGVYLSEDAVFDPDDRYVGYFYISSPRVPLNPGAAYEMSAQVSIPADAAPGQRYLLVVADGYYQQVMEANRANNARALDFTLGDGDLAVAQDSVSWATAPVTVGNWSQASGTQPAADFTFTAGEPVRLTSLETRHSGSPAQITLSLLDAAGTVLGAWEGTRDGDTWKVQVDRVLDAGTYRVSASDPASWYRSQTTGQGVARVVYTPTRTDLALQGSRITVSWTTVNTGQRNYESALYEGLYLSADPVWDPYEDLSLGGFSFSYSAQTPFAPDDSAVRQQTVKIPGTAADLQYLLVVADASRAFLETDETNNVQAIPITLAAPDLVLTDATTPSTAAWGQTIPVSWTVTNQGDYPAYADYWYDYVYISSNAVYDSYSDAQIGYATIQDPLPLAPGASYTVSASVKVLPTQAGDQYLIYSACPDAYYQGETLKENNIAARPIHVSPPPDLVVTDFSGPAAGSSGGVIEVAWTVANQGVGPAGAFWPDAILLSTDRNWSYSYPNADNAFFSQNHLGFFLSPGQTALLFSGYYGRVETGLNLNQSSAGPGATLEAWVLPTEAAPSGTPRYVVSTSSSYSGLEWSILQQGATWHVSNGIASLDTGVPVAVGVWQHVAAVFTPGLGITFYKNGVESFATDQIGYSLNDLNLMIGANPGLHLLRVHGLHRRGARLESAPDGQRHPRGHGRAVDRHRSGAGRVLEPRRGQRDRRGGRLGRRAPRDFGQQLFGQLRPRLGKRPRGRRVSGQSPHHPAGEHQPAQSRDPDQHLSPAGLHRLPERTAAPAPSRKPTTTNNYPSTLTNAYAGSAPITIENADLEILTAPSGAGHRLGRPVHSGFLDGHQRSHRHGQRQLLV